MYNESFYYYTDDIIQSQPFTLTMSGTVICDETYRNERENYPYCVFEYVLAGKGGIEVNSIPYSPTKDDIYIFRQGIKHKYYSDADDPWRKIWFTATGPLVDHLFQVYKLDNVCCVKGYGLLHYFQELQELLKSRNFDLKKKSSLIFHEFMYELYTLVNSFQQGHSQSAIKIKDFLDNHVETRVSIQDICRLVFRSPSQVIKIFNDSFGISPYRYLIQSRINTAKLLLLNQEIPIKEIAGKLQFADVHYFSNVFKKETGIPPTEFRKNCG